MSNLLSGLQTDNNLKHETDSLGGRQLLPTGIYQCMIAAAFLGESSGGAVNLTLALKTKTESGAEVEHKETIYFTNKNKETYYTKDGERHALPGYQTVESLVFIITGKTIQELSTEDKVIQQYSYEQKKEVPTTVPMVMDLVGQPVYAAINKVITNKQVKTDAGYADTNEKRELNELAKCFRASDKMTSAEIRANAESAEFFTRWVETKSGKDVVKFKEVANAPVAAAQNSGGAAAPTTSLFG